MTDRPATELFPLPDTGRRFTAGRTVRLGDVDPLGELRLDAVGRYLQDVASDDALAARLPNALGWVVRRTMIRVERPAVMGDEIELTTFCTGAGRSWAERRTMLRSGEGAVIDAVSLWVQIDTATGRPARLGDEFFEIYGPAAAGRQVSSKLSLPSRPPDDTGPGTPWRFRRADVDQLGHVNNAAQYSLVEEFLPAGGRHGTVEIEYLGPAEADTDYRVVGSGGVSWLVGDVGAVTVVAWTPA